MGLPVGETALLINLCISTNFLGVKKVTRKTFDDEIIVMALVVAAALNGAVIIFLQIPMDVIKGIWVIASPEVNMIASLGAIVFSGIIVLIKNSYDRPDRGYGYVLFQPTVEELIFRSPFILGFHGFTLMLPLSNTEYWGLWVIVWLVQAIVFAPGHKNPFKKFLLALVWFPLFFFVGIAPAAVGHTAHNMFITFLGRG